jgi:hypothetical protein
MVLAGTAIPEAIPASAQPPAPPRPAARVDGISDQSMPAWGAQGGALAAALFGARGADGSGPALARYVVQWNVLAQPSAGADAHGDYRERFEAWLADARDEGLGELVALTS